MSVVPTCSFRPVDVLRVRVCVCVVEVHGAPGGQEEQEGGSGGGVTVSLL